MTFLISLLANKYARSLIEAAGFALLVGLLVLHIYNAGKSAGAQSEKVQQVDKDRKLFDDAVSQYRDQLGAAARREEQAAKLVAQSQVNASRAAAAVTTTVATMQSDVAKVRALPAPAVQGDLESKLGGALSDPETLRKDDVAVTSYAPLQLETTQLQNQVSALRGEVGDQTQQIAALTKERDSAVAAYNAIIPLYTEAFNAIPRKRSILGHLCGVLTLYYGCRRPPRIASPEPRTKKT